MAGRRRNDHHLVGPAEVMQEHEILQEQWLIDDLWPLISDTNECIRWLARRSLLRNEYLCHMCGNRMCLHRYDQGIDGKRWACPTPLCRATKSIREGSWFQKSHLTLQVILKMAYLWSEDLPQKFLSRQLRVSAHTMVDWMNFTREICEEDILRDPQKIGGVNIDENGRISPKEVEIDESKYFHRKYHRGHWQPGHWVFGGIERGTGKCFLVEVADRRAVTLLPLILENIEPGTRIISDGWPSYANIDQMGGGGGYYTHDVVVHEREFVDADDPTIHTQNIENTWMRAKRKLRRQFGTSVNLFAGYLAEFMWRQKYKHRDPFSQLLVCIAQQY